MLKYLENKKVGVFETGECGWLFIKCMAGVHELEIRFREDDLYDLRYAIDDMIRHKFDQKK